MRRQNYLRIESTLEALQGSKNQATVDSHASVAFWPQSWARLAPMHAVKIPGVPSGALRVPHRGYTPHALRSRHALTLGVEDLVTTSRSQRGCRCFCKAGQKREARPSLKSLLSITPLAKQTPSTTQPSRESWNVFSLDAYNRPWQIPWGRRETAVGLFAWVFSFLLTSLLTVPVLIQISGTSIQELTAQQKTEYVLVNQVLETIIGIGTLRYVLRKFEPLPNDLFQFSISKPFAKPDGWAFWTLLGTAIAPFAVSTTAGVFTAAGYTEVGPGTVDEVVKILTPDTLTFAGLFAVTAVLAPILEEYVFRGFLLTSLTKFLPVPGAVLVSSLCFGAAHFSVKDFPELAVLGLLLGSSYIRSRNLLTPILIHGLWNGTTLAALYALAQTKV